MASTRIKMICNGNCILVKATGLMSVLIALSQAYRTGRVDRERLQRSLSAAEAAPLFATLCRVRVHTFMERASWRRTDKRSSTRPVEIPLPSHSYGLGKACCAFLLPILVKSFRSPLFKLNVLGSDSVVRRRQKNISFQDVSGVRTSRRTSLHDFT